MRDYIELTKSYLDKIRENDISKEYLRQKDFLEKEHPDLKSQIDDYRRRNFQFQNETDSDRLFDEVDVFEREYESFRRNPIVSDFLAAELAFCRQFQEIQEMVAEAFASDFDLN